MHNPAKLSFKIDEGIKVFHDKQKSKQYMTTNHNNNRISKEFCTQKMWGPAVSNYRKRKDKELENNIDSAAHKQTLKKIKIIKWQESPHTYQY
jgi:hypothetical protein